MATPKHGNNSTRLSLDIADLPLTPFGMSPSSSSSRRRRIFPSLKSNKLSLKTRKSPETKPQASSYFGWGSNVSRPLRFADDEVQHHRTSSRFTLETVDERNSSDQSDVEGDNDVIACDNESEETVDFQVLRTSTIQNQAAEESLSSRSNVTVRRRNRKDDAKEKSNRRDSIFTDIDEGDFVEFFQGKENGYVAPKVTCNIERHIPQLYYTCQSQNETQFSTSTKINNAPVGFRTFVEKVKTERPLPRMVQEEVEAVSPKGKTNFFMGDETIITGSADVVQRTKTKGKSKALNSTTVGWPVHQVRESLMPGLSDVSSLTLNTEKVTGSGSNNSTPYDSPKDSNRKSEVKTIIIAESSDEDESQITQNDNVYRSVRVNKPVVQKNQIEVVSSQEEFHSFVSEDVSIVSSALPVRKYQQPVKHVEASAKVLRYEYVEPSGDYDYTEDYTSESTVESDVDDVPLNSHAQMPVLPQMPILPQRQYTEKHCVSHKDIDVGKTVTPEEPKAIIPNTACPTVAGWIISSPFKDSSFGTSFLQKGNDSNVGRSVSQKAVEDSFSSESLPVFSQRLRSLPEFGSPRALVKKKLSEVSDDPNSSGVPLMRNEKHSNSDESEVLFHRKSRTTKVICSDSEDSCDEIESSRNNRITPEILVQKSQNEWQSKHQINNSSSASESFELRLSEEFSKTNRGSEKSIFTVGKDATSPKTSKSPMVHPDSDESVNIDQRVKRNTKKIVISESEESDSDGVCEETKEEDASYVSLPDIEDKGKLLSESSDDIFLHRKVKTNALKSPPSKPAKPEASLNLKMIQDELDKLYSSEWRKNESAILRSVKKKTKENGEEEVVVEVRDSSEEDEGPQKRYARKASNRILTSDESEEEEEDSILYQMEESAGEEEEEEEKEEENEYEDEDYEEREKRMTRKARKQDESYIPASSDGESDGNDDSFEKYLRNVKKQIAKDNKKINSQEDLNKYDDSFINDEDESEDDVSFYLPSLAERTKKNLSKDKDIDSKRRIGSYDPKGSVRSTKKSVTIKTSTSTSSWRDSPTITLSSDSESDEVFPMSEVKSRPPPMFPMITPKNKGRGKVQAKTEGLVRHVSKFKDIHRGLDTTPTLTFLASLSANVNLQRCHPEALIYTKNFKKSKEQLAEKLYTYYNTHVFENKLPATMNIKWNTRMTKTAGFCYYQIDRSKPSGRGARVELSTKVIDAAERLRDTLIHELCHAAAWIISGYKDGHGPLWKAWAAKATNAFPELPAISRCHSYEITCKYTYRCTRCSYSIGRHSKSLDTDRKVCGHCYGKFELVVNSQRGRGKSGADTPSQAAPKTPRTPGAFALFVKENYHSMKKSQDNLKHADVMKLLSVEFGKLKANNNK